MTISISVRLVQISVHSILGSLFDRLLQIVEPNLRSKDIGTQPFLGGEH